MEHRPYTHPTITLLNTTITSLLLAGSERPGINKDSNVDISRTPPKVMPAVPTPNPLALIQRKCGERVEVGLVMIDLCSYLKKYAPSIIVREKNHIHKEWESSELSI